MKCVYYAPEMPAPMTTTSYLLLMVQIVIFSWIWFFYPSAVKLMGRLSEAGENLPLSAVSSSVFQEVVFFLTVFLLWTPPSPSMMGKLK